jgi:hypothetical protein
VLTVDTTEVQYDGQRARASSKARTQSQSFRSAAIWFIFIGGCTCNVDTTEVLCHGCMIRYPFHTVGSWVRLNSTFYE